jgi:hypothetical protein
MPSAWVRGGKAPPPPRTAHSPPHTPPPRPPSHSPPPGKCIDTYKQALIVTCDNVGSRQMQQIRIALRGTAIVCMGKSA